MTERPELIGFDLPCAKCGSSLRNHLRHGQCCECGLQVSKSVSVAACRVHDPESLQQIGVGLGAQAWGTLLALLACVCGPLIYDGGISFEAFGFVVTAVLGVISCAILYRSRGKQRDRAHTSRLVAGAIGSWAVVIPALVMRMETTGSQFQSAALVFLLVGAIFWFVGECSKLHLLEHWSTLIAGIDLRQRARNLRWGVYAALGTVAAALVPAAISGLSSTSYMTAQFVLTICVALLVLTLMSAMLQGKLSAEIEQQVSFARAVKQTAAPVIKPEELPDEPNWVIWPHPPRWSSY